MVDARVRVELNKGISVSINVPCSCLSFLVMLVGPLWSRSWKQVGSFQKHPNRYDCCWSFNLVYALQLSLSCGRDRVRLIPIISITSIYTIYIIYLFQIEYLIQIECIKQKYDY